MGPASVLALLCLIASGLLDLVYKLYASQPRSRGMLIFGIGCVWLLLQLSTVVISGVSVSINQATLIYGVSAAVFVTLSNILLLECMGGLPISVGSTIYRLNTVPLVILAFLFLGENIDWIRGAGIALGVFTVLLLYQPVEIQRENREHVALFTLLIIIASLLRALYGVFTKAGISNGGDPNSMMIFAALGWCIGGLLYAWLRENRVVLTRSKLKYIPVAGFLVFSIVWLLTTALTLGDASVVVPVANMGFVAAFVLSVVLRLEQFSKRKVSALVCAILSIVLLTHSV